MNEEKLHALLGKMVNELGAAVMGVHVILGDKLQLYKTLAQAGPLSSPELAEKTGTHERYIREWLAAQAASGYVDYHPDSARFSMSPEQSAILANEESPVFMAGGFYGLESAYADEPKMAQRFKTGEGVAWSDHCNCLFCGVEKFFKPSYQHNLVQHWLPALDGLTEKLEQGIQVADVGCGYGVSTILMAQAYPQSTFYGYDFHAPSIQKAQALAQESGLSNVEFALASAKTFPQLGYDLIACFDCFHDMGDPLGAAQYIKESLNPEGTWMLVEPMAGDTLEENLNPVGRVYYGFSTLVCVPTSLDQEVGAALGAQAGEKKLREVIIQGGFGEVRRALDTPFNMILEAKV